MEGLEDQIKEFSYKYKMQEAAIQDLLSKLDLIQDTIARKEEEFEELEKVVDNKGV